jgi:NitT/TauT family transport system permease protein
MSTFLDLLAALGASWARIAVALLLSMAAAFVVGIAAATNKRLEALIIPALDVLQSVPILGFFPLAIAVLVSVSPVTGPELASVFLIFTCTFWNFAFSVYEAVRNVPVEIREALSLWRVPLSDRLRKVYIPVSLPRLASNLQPSTANAWFFLTASEVMSIGEAEYRVFGVGSLITDLIYSGDISMVTALLALTLGSIGLVQYAVYAPLAEWASKFVAGSHPSARPRIFTGLATIGRGFRTVGHGIAAFSRVRQLKVPVQIHFVPQLERHGVPFVTLMGLVLLGAAASTLLVRYSGDLMGQISLLVWRFAVTDWGAVGAALAFSTLRVAAVLFLSLLWSVPLAYYLALDQTRRRRALPVLQVLVSVPAPLLYPIIAPAFASSGPMGKELGALVMMLMGSQYYVFYGALQGFMVVEPSYTELVRLSGLSFWKSMRLVYLPMAMPSIVTGLITGAGGAWNATVVSERLEVGPVVYATDLPGLGKAISEVAAHGDVYGLLVLVIVMTGFIVLLNRTFWAQAYSRSIKAVSG